jgi:hypothetical protein
VQHNSITTAFLRRHSCERSFILTAGGIAMTIWEAFVCWLIFNELVVIACQELAIARGGQ